MLFRSIAGLKPRGSQKRIRRPAELRDDRVAPSLEGLATLSRDRLRKPPKRALDALVCENLIGADERGGARDVGMQEYGQLRLVPQGTFQSPLGDGTVYL